MTAFQRLKELIDGFFAKALTPENTEDFCNTYMDLFDELAPELEKEVDEELYYIFDDVKWACDSYEKIEAIREEYKCYLDEEGLREEVSLLRKKLNESMERHGE